MNRDLKRLLHGIEKPGRYTGGEYGTLRKTAEGLLRVAICYPDIYEIGMSNLSVRLIYRLLNGLEGVACERVFAPGLDFEQALRARGLPLYALESGSPLSEFDLVGFSVGYELTFTNLLNILDLGGISLRRKERSANEPIVIAGGPAITNPIPFGPFLDAVFIGEIEGEALPVFEELGRMKRGGAGREDLLARLAEQPFVWTADAARPVRRALWTGFGREAPGNTSRPPFIVPSIRTVQDHGVVEIMRGCPNGCRFCQAGNFYRPFRLKESEAISGEVRSLVYGCGYREITLSSLSSGDYPGLAGLVRALNRRLRQQKVSFSLPSLRIDSLALELLSEISAVRKSGLTFAVETPDEPGQRALNKIAPLDRTIEILLEARTRGWRAAKFYFMVGLPGAEEETEPIIEFLSRVRRRTGMSITANIGSFIPKPHTAFQWSAQLPEKDALDRIMRIKKRLPAVQVRYHAPFLSFLEGLISRGDKRAGELALRAFREGARFDSWEDLARRDVWRKVIGEASWDVEADTCRERALAEPLPWRMIRLGVSQAFLKAELRRSRAGELTPPCRPDCGRPCGVCRGAVQPGAEVGGLSAEDAESAVPLPGAPLRVLFSFAKKDEAAFLGHLDILGIFERAFLRAGLQPVFTEGFNPKPRLEFAHPLALGIESGEEIAMAELAVFDGEEAFRRALNPALPPGLAVLRAKALPPYRPGTKKHSLMALYWGADYQIRAEEDLGKVHALSRALLADASSSAWRLLEAPAEEPPALRLRVPASAKPANILKILARYAAGEPVLRSFSVLRERSWATGASGEPLPYFELPF